MPHWNLPEKKPEGISHAAWFALHANPVCARFGIECQWQCSTDLAVDHVKARSTKGSNDLGNLRWLCDNENRIKGAGSDPRWRESCYFDRQINTERLRAHQLGEGYLKVVSPQWYKQRFQQPEGILDRIILLPWFVGSGKTIGMLSILFGINHVRRAMGPTARVRRVLWLAHQTSFLEGLEEELKAELPKHGICDKAPRVVRVTDAGKWGYVDVDIVLATPQSLWPVNGRALKAERRAQILGEFDAVIVDEAQFGMDQYLELLRQAPKAYKFAITATPMDGAGKMFYEMEGGRYKHKFARFSIVDFESGRKLTVPIYKALPEFSAGFGSQYKEVAGGDSTVSIGVKDYTDHETELKSQSRTNALLGEARRRLECLDRATGYANHAMVVFGSVGQAKLVYEQQKGAGDVCIVIGDGMKPALGNCKHPWMLVKRAEGKLPPGAKRIVFCVDIGQFGINNKYCSVIVFAHSPQSLIEIIQRIGRAVRAGGAQDEKVYILWDAADGGADAAGNDVGFRLYLQQALQYIHEFAERMKGFPALDDLCVPQENEGPEAETPPLEKPIRRLITEQLGLKLAAGATPIEAHASCVEYIKRQFQSDDPNRQAALKYAGEFCDNPIGQFKREHRIPGIFEAQPIVKAEDAHESEYLPENLSKALLECQIFPDISDDARVSMSDGIQSVEPRDRHNREIAEKALRAIHKVERDLLETVDYHLILRGNQKNYEGRSYVRDVTNTLNLMWGMRHANATLDWKQLWLEVKKAVDREAALYFGLPNVQRDTVEARGLARVLPFELTCNINRARITRRAELRVYQAHPEWFPGNAYLTAQASSEEGEWYDLGAGTN